MKLTLSVIEADAGSIGRQSRRHSRGPRRSTRLPVPTKTRNLARSTTPSAKHQRRYRRRDGAARDPAGEAQPAAAA